MLVEANLLFSRLGVGSRLLCRSKEKGKGRVERDQGGYEVPDKIAQHWSEGICKFVD